MLKHKWPEGIKGKLTHGTVKALFIDYLQQQVLDAKEENPELVGGLNITNAVVFSDLTADFIVQLLDLIHPVSIMERGFKNDN